MPSKWSCSACISSSKPRCQSYLLNLSWPISLRHNQWGRQNLDTTSQLWRWVSTTSSTWQRKLSIPLDTLKTLPRLSLTNPILCFPKSIEFASTIKALCRGKNQMATSVVNLTAMKVNSSVYQSWKGELKSSLPHHLLSHSNMMLKSRRSRRNWALAAM